MVFAFVFFLNAAANFALGVVLGALLGPAEFGRYATVALAATTLGGAMFDWLRLSSLRFSGDSEARVGVAASLDAGYLLMMALLYLSFGALALVGVDFGLPPPMLALTPLAAVALHRVDFSGAQFRARDQARAFAALYGLRQALIFTIVVATAYFSHSAMLTIAALAFASLVPAIALAGALRTSGARLRDARARNLLRFALYAKPVVASMVIFQLVVLINRQYALSRLGAAPTGELSLAADLGIRLFWAFNTLPDMWLFQMVLRSEREQGRAAAERRIGENSAIAFALLAPLTAGYMVMAPTFEALMVPAAFHGDFARLSFLLAPGFAAQCAVTSMLNPVLQLKGRTWPATIAALCALGADFAVLSIVGADSVDALARAYTISMFVGFVVAAAMTLGNPAVRPRLRDLALTIASTVAMTAAIEPLNRLPSHALAAALALLVGGAIFGAVVAIFDVAGLRGMAMARWRGGAPAPMPRVQS